MTNADNIDHDLFMKALFNVKPELADITEYLTNPSDNTVRTFEDCAKVEQDIITRLNAVARTF